jgi:hypothetical protein
VTVTPLDPVGPLNSRTEVVDFTVSTDPLETTISVQFPSGAWEMVYQDGVFNRQLYLESTRDGSTFHVKRIGGWPQSPSFKVKETVTGPTLSPGMPYAALGTTGVCWQTPKYNTSDAHALLFVPLAVNLSTNHARLIAVNDESYMVYYGHPGTLEVWANTFSGQQKKLATITLTTAHVGKVCSIYMQGNIYQSTGTTVWWNGVDIAALQPNAKAAFSRGNTMLVGPASGESLPNLGFVGGLQRSNTSALTQSDVDAWHALIKQKGRIVSMENVDSEYLYSAPVRATGVGRALDFHRLATGAGVSTVPSSTVTLGQATDWAF